MVGLGCLSSTLGVIDFLISFFFVKMDDFASGCDSVFVSPFNVDLLGDTVNLVFSDTGEDVGLVSR